MSVVKINIQDEDCTSISNKTINDPTLSWKAKGILIYILSTPNNWEFNLADIKNHSSGGIKNIKSGIKELEKNGYCIKKGKNRNRKTKKFTNNEYIFYGSKNINKNNDLVPLTSFGQTLNGHTQMRPISNTEYSNTYISVLDNKSISIINNLNTYFLYCVNSTSKYTTSILHTDDFENDFINKINTFLEKSGLLNKNFFLKTQQKVKNMKSTSIKNCSHSTSNYTKDESNTKIHPIVQFWNTQPNLTTHKMGTKNYRKIIIAIRDLKQGSFYKKNSLDPKFLKYNDILQTVIDKKWDEDSIKQAIINLNNVHNKAYSLHKKTKYPKSFMNCLFNPVPYNYQNGGTSMFLKFYYNPPKLKSSIKQKDKYPHLTKQVIDFISKYLKQYNFSFPYNPKDNNFAAAMNISKIMSFVDKYIEKSPISTVKLHLASRKEPGDKFFSVLFEFIEDKMINPDKIGIYLFSVDSWVWYEFWKYFQWRHNISLEYIKSKIDK